MSFIRSVSDTMIIPQISCLTQQAIVWHALYLLMKPNQISSQSITLHASVLTPFCPYALISPSQFTVGIKITAAMWKVTGEFDSCGLWPIQAPLPSKSGPCRDDHGLLWIQYHYRFEQLLHPRPMWCAFEGFVVTLVGEWLKLVAATLIYVKTISYDYPAMSPVDLQC